MGYSIYFNADARFRIIPPLPPDTDFGKKLDRFVHPDDVDDDELPLDSEWWGRFPHLSFNENRNWVTLDEECRGDMVSELRDLLENVVLPAGCQMFGDACWDGEDDGDSGRIMINGKEILVFDGVSSSSFVLRDSTCPSYYEFDFPRDIPTSLPDCTEKELDLLASALRLIFMAEVEFDVVGPNARAMIKCSVPRRNLVGFEDWLTANGYDIELVRDWRT